MSNVCRSMVPPNVDPIWSTSVWTLNLTPVYLEGWKRSARTFQNLVESTEHIVQGLRLRTSLFAEYCIGSVSSFLVNFQVAETYGKWIHEFTFSGHPRKIHTKVLHRILAFFRLWHIGPRPLTKRSVSTLKTIGGVRWRWGIWDNVTKYIVSQGCSKFCKHIYHCQEIFL